MKKTCAKCNTPKELGEFRKAKRYSDGHYSYCLGCEKTYQADWHQKNKLRINKINSQTTAERKKVNQQWLWDYLLENPCVDCGEEDPVVLQFDHVLGKKFKAVKAMLVYGLERIKREVSKCLVRCANCHSRKTAIEREYYKNIDRRGWHSDSAPAFKAE